MWKGGGRAGLRRSGWVVLKSASVRLCQNYCIIAACHCRQKDKRTKPGHLQNEQIFRLLGVEFSKNNFRKIVRYIKMPYFV